MIYLDHNSTTPIAPDVANAISNCYAAGYVNPASQHELGRQARRKLEEAREGIAEILGAKTTGMDADSLIFTSGGTEANNLAIFGLSNAACGTAAASPSQRTFAISSIEHPSVVGPAEELERRGWQLERLRVTRDGVVELSHVEELLPALRTRHSALSIMLGNNETGVLQPVPEIASLCREAEVPIHTDAVQVAGKLPIDFRDLNVDAMTITAHKFHGPRGIGALVLRHGTKLEPMLYGGFQQGGLRPGTEDVALAVGMHKALQFWNEEREARRVRLEKLRDQFEQGLAAGDSTIVVNGAGARRLGHTSNVSFPGVDRQALLMALDMAGVACSTGSACASGSSEPSPVLIAMGCAKEVISGSLRFSLGATTTANEIDEAVRRILLAVNQLRHGKNADFKDVRPRESGAESV